ncbi:phosphotransferase [Sphingobium mellinum]|uniref:phosphotransferase n=1 Tax=Sphingobium mellinum TaxID=1387166 RepID=UPI0030ECEA20
MGKLTQSDPSLWYSNLNAMYANELDFYARLRSEVDLEAPIGMGGAMDDSGRYILLMEDVSKRGATFHTVLTEDVTLDHVRAILTTLARLHARYWDSPRFKTDLAWVQTMVSGDLESLMRQLIGDGISSEIRLRKFKREFLGIMGVDEERLRQGSIKMKEHQATLTPTILHGDSHLGNMYFLPDMTGGLLDWQLVAKGYIAHDVGYFITVSLPVDVRRREERALLDFYLEKLKQFGAVNPPDRETLWLEYRRTLIWGVYIGWLTVPEQNYGWEHSVVCHLRVINAFIDHDTMRLVDEL